MGPLKRVAAYCRVSTDKSDQINSLANQQRFFEDYIKNHSEWILAEIYTDEGISGTDTRKRQNFNRMIADAEQGKIDLILTKEVSRFARNTVDTLEYVRRLAEKQVYVIFISDNINTQDKGEELRLTIMASIAQEESRKTSERVKWGQKRSMEKGVVFGRDLLGYTVKNGRLSVNRKEAETVRLIFHKFLNEGKGTHVIARELQEAGIKPKREKQWSNSVILRLLRNEKYAGDLLQQKTFTPNYLNHKKRYNRGEAEQIYIKDHHEAIIDRIIWKKTQAELARRSPRENGAKHSSRYWCSGMLVCGECGASFVSRTKICKDGSIYRAWRCFRAAEHGTRKNSCSESFIGCDSHSVNEKALLFCANYVLTHLQIHKGRIIGRIKEDLKTVMFTNPPTDASVLYKKTDRLKEKKTAVINLLAENVITTDEMIMMKNEYDRELEETLKSIQLAEEENSMRKERMQAFESSLTKMLDENLFGQLVLKETIQKIVVCNDNILLLYLKAVPFGVKIKYAVKGRKGNYQVLIREMEVIH